MSNILRKLLCSRSAAWRHVVLAQSRSFADVKQNILCQANVRQLKCHSRQLSKLNAAEQNQQSAKVREDRSEILLEMREAGNSEAYASQYLENLEGDDLDFLKLIQLEYYVLDSEGAQLPSEDSMNNQRWLSLFAICPSRSSRIKMYRYWTKVDNIKARSRVEKDQRRKIDEERRAEVSIKQESGQLGYTNRILHRVYDTSMNVHYYSNLFHAMQFGCKIIFDFSFEDSMAFNEIKFALDQTVLAYGANKIHREPFHMIWTNVKPDSKVRKMLPKAVRDFEDKPFTVTEQSYLDMFPKEQLAWLSPNATEVMKDYDPETVYIVGGIVDTKGQPPLTWARAKKEGIRAYKLPVDRYLQWDKGTKNLTLDQVMKIMLEVKLSRNWHKALKHVPSRKIRARLN